MSDISSAGITRGTPGYGKTCRKDVLGGVEVPVMLGAAIGARPAACPQAQFREQVSARRAGLRAGVPPVEYHQFSAGPLALVLELAAELAPCALCRPPSQGTGFLPGLKAGASSGGLSDRIRERTDLGHA